MGNIDIKTLRRCADFSRRYFGQLNMEKYTTSKGKINEHYINTNSIGTQ